MTYRFVCKDGGTTLWSTHSDFNCKGCDIELRIPFYFCPESKECFCDLCQRDWRMKESHLNRYGKRIDTEGTKQHMHLEISQIKPIEADNADTS